MHLILTEDYEELNRVGADLVAEVIAASPTATMFVATDSTPIGIYRELAARRQRGVLNASRLRVIQLDEYIGVESDDRRSLYGWMVSAFVEPLGVPIDQIIRLPGNAPDPKAACRAFDHAVQTAGGIDLAILGLGPNGRLGFNEPPADATAPTRTVDLTEESIQSNSRYLGGRELVPRRAMTAGMSTLLAARQTLLVVSGAHKHAILRAAVEGPVTPDVPASYLQAVSGVTVLADQAAWQSPSATHVYGVRGLDIR